MSFPNTGPEHPDPKDPGAVETSRRGNPSLVFRDEPVTDEVSAASSRASAVSHKFGGVRYALNRPGVTTTEPPAEEGESDARQ